METTVHELVLKTWLPILKHNGFAFWASKLASKPIRVPTHLGPYLLHAEPTGHAPSGSYLCISVTSDKGTGNIYLPINLFTCLPHPWKALLDTSHLDDSVSDLKTQIFPLVVEHILADALDLFDFDISLGNILLVEDTIVRGATFSWTSQDYSRSNTIYIDLEDALTSQFVSPEKSKSHAFKNLPVDASLCALALWFLPKDIAGLVPGNSIDCTSVANPKLLSVVGGAAKHVTTGATHWEGQDPFTSITYPISSQDTPMNNATDIDSISVLVTFEVGRKTISLKELQKQGPGAVFDIAPLDRAEIIIRANDTPIGTARMVQLDDRLAVQILKVDANV